jgi:hypothetical protein
MTIFAILMPTPQPSLVERIKAVYPSDYLEITETQWLVSASSTAIDVSAKLGIADPKALAAPATGTAIIFATSAYYGRAAQPIWDWMKTKLEAPPVAAA